MTRRARKGTGDYEKGKGKGEGEERRRSGCEFFKGAREVYKTVVDQNNYNLTLN